MLYWDPAVVAELRTRGADIADITARIDRVIGELPSLSDAEVQREWDLLARFYFSHTADPEREAPFRARLRLP
jgi:hypothetical protein